MGLDEVSVAFEEVVGAGEDGEGEGEIKGDVAEDSEEFEMDDEVKQEDDKGGHLDGGFEFTIEGSGDGNAVARRHHAHTVDGEVTNQDDCENPEGHDAKIGEDEKGEVDEHFVCERIEEGAEVGDFLAFAGPVAVDFVGDGGNNEDDEGGDPRPSVGKHCKNHEDNRKEHAENS